MFNYGLGWLSKWPSHFTKEWLNGFSASWESSICERKLHYPGNRTQDTTPIRGDPATIIVYTTLRKSGNRNSENWKIFNLSHVCISLFFKGCLDLLEKHASQHNLFSIDCDGGGVGVNGEQHNTASRDCLASKLKCWNWPGNLTQDFQEQHKQNLLKILFEPGACWPFCRCDQWWISRHRLSKEGSQRLHFRSCLSTLPLRRQS